MNLQKNCYTNGRQVSITDTLGTRTNIYDGTTLQLVAEKLPDGTVLARTQDDFGRPAGIALDADYALAYGYDALGRFTAITSSVSSVQSVVEYSYLQGSDLLSGWSSSEGNSHTRTFEPNRNLITDIENHNGTNLVSSYAYTNDELGRRTARVDSATVTNTFAYNLRSEVIAAIMGENDHGYAYDPIGNRLHAILNNTTNTYTANELNQYTNVSNGVSVAPVFDDDGNMVEYGDWTFEWDGENRLIEVASNSVTVVHNQYDYMSRRVMKATATETNSYLYDSWNMIREIKTPNNQSPITNNFIWGLDLSQSMQGAGGVGGLLMTVIEGDPFFPAYDANGNITHYADTNGTIVAHYEYDPFGGVSAKSGGLADEFVYRFSTKYTDDETGLVWYGYRFYNPELGRWVNRDPTGEEGGLGLYSFVYNYPVGEIDLFGLAPRNCESVSLNVRLLSGDSFGVSIGPVGVEGAISANLRVSGRVCEITCSSGGCGKEIDLNGTLDFRSEVRLYVGWVRLGRGLQYHLGARGVFRGTGEGTGTITGNTCTDSLSAGGSAGVAFTGRLEGGGMVQVGRLRAEAYVGGFGSINVGVVSIGCDKNTCIVIVGSLTARVGGHWRAQAGRLTLGGTFAEREYGDDGGPPIYRREFPTPASISGLLD